MISMARCVHQRISFLGKIKLLFLLTGRAISERLSYFINIKLLFITQVGWFTSDGAAVNRTTLRTLQNNSETAWMAQEHDML
jgi:hypothetical protein